MVRRRARQEEEYEEEEEAPPARQSRFDEDDATLAAALSAQLQSAPWYVGSILVHMALFVILMLIPPPPQKQKPRRVVVKTTMEEEEKPEFEEKPQEEKPTETTEITTQTDVKVDTQVKTTDIEVSTEIETVDNSEEAKDDPLAVVGIGDVGNETSGPNLMGVSGNGSGKGRFGTRLGTAKRTNVRRGGGNAKTEMAVDMALQWLAAHQEPDGSWDPIKNGREDKSDVKVGVSSMALLAFLGAGNSTRFGKYKKNVKNGVAWLVKQQSPKEPGRMGGHSYQAALALMVVAEAYGMSDESSLKSVAQDAVEYAERTQCPDTWGWDYNPTNKYRVDTSPTGWWVMGIKSARVAGLKTKRETFTKAMKYFEAAVDPKTGACMYSAPPHSDKPAAKKELTMDDVKANAGKGGPAMAGVALCCLQFLGAAREDPLVKATAAYITKPGMLPQVGAKGDVNFYLWYYQALGLFQLGIRSREWQVFVKPMVETLLTLQRRDGTVEEYKGSWDHEKDHWGKSWSRVGQTALGALMLEVFYRYADAHKAH